MRGGENGAAAREMRSDKRVEARDAVTVEAVQRLVEQPKGAPDAATRASVARFA